MRRHAPGTLAFRPAERHVRPMATGHAVAPWVVIAGFVALATLPATATHAGNQAVPGIELERLIERFDGGASTAADSVHLDAWIEPGAERHQVVVVVEARGDFKLVADPGITVTPTAQPGVEWLVPIPFRHVDPEIPYFSPPATLRLPFRANGVAPVEILVEYAYCVVDYQCFFGEEVLRVAARYD
jgi:hypothetical protein